MSQIIKKIGVKIAPYRVSDKNLPKGYELFIKTLNNADHFIKMNL